jgi:nucleoid-associated protein YgaU
VKTGWEPPSPQKVRVNETRMGILLAFCLLVALGFVAYRKFDEQGTKPADGKDFVAANKDGAKPPAISENASDLRSESAGPMPAAALHGWSTDTPSGASARSSSTPAAMHFADSRLPDQTEPPSQNDEPAFGSAATFDRQPAELPPQSDPTSLTTTDEPSNPFAGGTDSTTTDDSSASLDFVADTSDPFTGGTVTATEPQSTVATDTGDWSSDAGSAFSAPADVDSSATDVGLAVDVPTLQPANEPADDAAVADMPVMDLFGGEPATESLPEQDAEPGAPSLPAASPWGDAAGAPAVAETAPPQRFEPNDPQVMPTLTLGPFDAPQTEVEPAQPETNPSEAFDPFPAATATTDVPESQHGVATATDTVNPFASDEMVTVRQRPSASPQDPFAPAHDISQAVSEDEVVVHQVQSGDNFWKIAQQHYGAGKYFTALAAYNQPRIPDPRRMRPGMKVLVPSEATLAQQFPQLVSGGTNVPYVTPPSGPAGFSLDAQGRPQYRVVKGDTLSRIAELHLGRASRWRQLYGMNRDQLPSADSLTTGMLLRLPADASQVRVDASGTTGR